MTKHRLRLRSDLFLSNTHSRTTTTRRKKKKKTTNYENNVIRVEAMSLVPDHHHFFVVAFLPFSIYSTRVLGLRRNKRKI